MSLDQITPPLKYHGSKSRYMAPHIHALASKASYLHRNIPFGGGIGELWNWEHEGISEVVNDLDGRLTNLWRVLKDPQLFGEFQRQVQAIPFSQHEWEEARNTFAHRFEGRTWTTPQTDVDLAVAFFVFVRQSMAGRMKSFAPLSRTRVRRNMNEQASAWLNAIEGLPEVHHRLKRVAILTEDALTEIVSQDGPATLHYCDQPYLPETRTAKTIYSFEMSYDQHVQLLGVLKACRGKVILSGYANELYDRELCDWNRETHDLPNNSASGASKRRMVEVLWSNF